MKKIVIFIFLTFLFHNTFAAEVTESFSTRTHYATGLAIWNQALGAAHPTLRVMNFSGGATKPVFVGDGRDGSFDVSTYALFSENGDLSGNIIRYNTDKIMQVTYFKLEAGWRLEPVGNKPLTIYSLSDVIIEGEIWCHGKNGGNANNTTPGEGGEGRCGGARGGDGGLPAKDGSHGSNIVDGVVTGGRAGNYTGGAAVAGGGGGSWNTTSNPSDGANVNVGGGIDVLTDGGQAGVSNNDPTFVNNFGGAGGGGGSGSATEAGAGGGGGGGTVIINAARDFFLGSPPNSLTGFIYVNGGAGGNSNVNGGAGGGGGGGSMQVFVGRAIEIFNTTGTGAGFGNGGQPGTNLGAASGGTGGPGRSWYSSVIYNASGTGIYVPTEHISIAPGNVEFHSDPQQVESKSFDLISTKPTITAITPTPVSPDFQLEIAGSSDNFINDDTGWTTDLNLVKNKRYVKFRATITTGNVNSPTMLDAVTVVYTPGNINDFDFVASGCGMVQDVSFPPSSSVPFLLPFILLLGIRSRTLKFKAQ